MRFAVNVPNFGRYGSPEMFGELASITEVSGWDGLFVWDHILVWDGNEVHDPWMLMSVAAARTEHILIGPMVTPLPRRRPWQVARQATTLDHLSRGRVVLGVGIGAPQEVEFDWFGEASEAGARAEMLDEGLAILRGLWSGEPFSFEGKHFKLHEMTFRPTPVQTTIPIWVAGGWPSKRPFERAARFEGVFPIDAPSEGFERVKPEDLSAIVELIESHRSGEEPFDVSVFLWPPKDGRSVAQLVDSYRRAGATWLHIGPHFEEPVDAFVDRVKAGPPSPP